MTYIIYIGYLNTLFSFASLGLNVVLCFKSMLHYFEIKRGIIVNFVIIGSGYDISPEPMPNCCQFDPLEQTSEDS